MYVYGAALWWPERLKAPSEQEVILHNLYWERPEGILTNKVVYARATSSGGVRRGENPGGNFSAERLSGEPVGSFLQLFKNIFPLFRFFFTKNVFDQKFFELKFWDLNFCWSEILDNKFLNLQFSDPKYCLNSNIFFGLQFFLDLF